MKSRLQIVIVAFLIVIFVLKGFFERRYNDDRLYTFQNTAWDIKTKISKFFNVTRPCPTLQAKMFLYLVQVKECLLDKHASNDSLFHNGDFDVLAYSYFKPCLKDHPPHVRYINLNSTASWTVGRNFLYRYASTFMSRDYMYYIFMDEDIVLANNVIPRELKNKRFSAETLAIINQKESPWRKFEKFLNEYRPAIGSIENQIRMSIKFKSLATPEIKPYYSGFDFDAQINAFHRDVWASMLPYNDTLEGRSWILSQELQICRAFFRYHGHMVYFIPVIAFNYVHSKYPRGIDPPMDSCRDEYNLAPDFIKHFPLTQKLMSTKVFYDMPEFYDYVAPPRTPITQYSYFDGNFTAS